ncbi:CCA-adding enzyme [compost metagenome]
MLTFGVEAAEGWLSLLAILPAAALPAANSPADSEVSPAVNTQAVSKDSPAITAPAVPAREWIAQMPLKSLSELAVTGNELAEVLEKRPGPWLGNMLSALLQATASGDLLNNKQELLLEAKRMDGHEL